MYVGICVTARSISFEIPAPPPRLFRYTGSLHLTPLTFELSCFTRINTTAMSYLRISWKLWQNNSISGGIRPQWYDVTHRPTKVSVKPTAFEESFIYYHCLSDEIVGNFRPNKKVNRTPEYIIRQVQGSNHG